MRTGSDSLPTISGTPSGGRCRKEFAQSREVTAREAADFAVEHCFEQYSVVPERELLRVGLLHGMGCVSEEQILRELPRHGVFVQELDGRRMATTEALQAEEDDIARFADRGRFARARRSASPRDWTGRWPTANA